MEQQLIKNWNKKVVNGVSIQIVELTRVSCTFMRNTELYLLNSGWKNLLNISFLFVFYIILSAVQYFAWQRWILLNSYDQFVFPLSNIRLNIKNILQSKRKINISGCQQ
jgi:hypothetical protein